MKKRRKSTISERKTDELLLAYRNQRGVYSNVATKLGVDASYVSRVANGQRKSETIRRAIAAELSKVQNKTIRKPDGKYLKCPHCGSEFKVNLGRKN